MNCAIRVTNLASNSLQCAATITSQEKRLAQ